MILEFRVMALGFCAVFSCGFKLQGLGFCVPFWSILTQKLSSWIAGSGFRVSGFGCKLAASGVKV